MPKRFHAEHHRADRIGWLRAAVLGANDGIISTASLLLGVAAAQAGRDTLLATGTAALVAGALSMAAGEYVSVSSQADTERADLRREADELAANPPAELAELAGIYEQRGVEPALARRVAEQLTAHDAWARMPATSWGCRPRWRRGRCRRRSGRRPALPPARRCRWRWPRWRRRAAVAW